MKIHAEVIQNQRYPTAGDWTYTPIGDIEVKVSALGHPAMEACVMVHEIVEAVLCRFKGIRQETVDQFDIEFKGEGEPGDDPQAPYYFEHQVATAVERLIARELLVNWTQYEKAVNSLFTT